MPKLPYGIDNGKRAVNGGRSTDSAFLEEDGRLQALLKEDDLHVETEFCRDKTIARVRYNTTTWDAHVIYCACGRSS